MTETYSRYAHICAKFYELTLDAKGVAEFVMANSGMVTGDRALFVGGMFEVAAHLAAAGIGITAVDYSDEMVAVGRRRLPQCDVLRADLREIPGDGEFDAVLVVGRVFTHMVTNQDLRSAVDSCRRALRPSGRLFADNYEDTRIQVTKYFNGSIQVQDDRCTIKRDSTTELRSTSPFVVDWRAEYSGVIEGEPFRFSDSIPHRAFSRAEFAEHLGNGGFQVIAQGDNFDETSFFTVSRRAT